MYNQYFQFQEAPFSIAPNPRFLYMSTRHQEALAHLLYGIDNGGGFVALTGDIGTGKTTLCRSLLESLPENVDIALITNPKLNPIELLATICDELGITYPQQETSLKILVDCLNKRLLDSHAQGKRTILIIDEAQNLSLEALEQIRLLTNLETSEIKLLQIILVGQPELQLLLNDKNLRQLNQRISGRYHLQALSLAETEKYIQHRLLTSKGDPRLFNTAAAKTVYRHSTGIPRLINIICDRALLGAYASNKKTITPAIVNKAAHETLATKTNSDKKLRLIRLTSLVAVFFGVLFFYLNYNPTDILKQFNFSGQASKSKTLDIKSTTAKIKLQKVPETKPALPAIPVPVPAKKLDWIFNNQELNLNNALTQLINTWNKSTTNNNNPSNCADLNTINLYCLSGTSTWQRISSLNRPVILELSEKDSGTRYVLVTHILPDKLELRINDKPTHFNTDELLSTWRGHYILAWRPNSKQKYIYPNTSSTQVMWLRELFDQADGKISPTTNRDFYDNKLMARVLTFQRKNQLLADGVVGPRTMIHLQNISNTANAPTLF